MKNKKELTTTSSRPYFENMENINEYTKNLFRTDEYITKNPSLHEEDSPWKVSKIVPLIDEFIDHINKDEINLLDVGGGAGLILNMTSNYIKDRYGLKVNKFALDLSPGMLEIQKKRNPDLLKALNEDISKTSLDDKKIDLTLLIDLLEHIPNSIEALEEVKRISKFAIFKVPLENNLYIKTWNFIKRGKPRQNLIEILGHINVYNFGELKYQIQKHSGQVLDSYFTNVFDYFQNSEHYKNKRRTIDKLIHFVAAHTYKLSPKLCTFIFNDFAMILVKCY